MLSSLEELAASRFETPSILKKVALASRALAELKGAAASIPNQGILINTLGIQEAKDSSEVENIVTTHDEVFRGDAILDGANGPASKEVLRYREALAVGYAAVIERGILTLNDIRDVQATLVQNSAGFRRVPGTALKDGTGRTIYTPPQDEATIVHMMTSLERFINDEAMFDADPLVKMALIHHHFESIHPFYDGNGRTGRIINVLYLVKEQLLDSPVLYLSRYIVRTKREYYHFLQDVRDRDAWEAWVLYMLSGIESTARASLLTVNAIKAALIETKHEIRARHKFYSQDLINSLFTHPYTKIQFLERDLGVGRLTATRYLDALARDGLLLKLKVGRSSYYVNRRLVDILTAVT